MEHLKARSEGVRTLERDGQKPERLAELEGVIERGLITFVEVGLALMEIRDQRLYRESHGTFEAYCQERWGWERAHAYRLMEGAKVSALLSPTGDVPAPQSERVARELAHEPETMREVWGEVVEKHGPEPTAAEVREVVAPRLAVAAVAPPTVRAKRDATKDWDEETWRIFGEDSVDAAESGLRELESLARERGRQYVNTKYVLKMLGKVEARCRRIRDLLEPAS